MSREIEIPVTFTIGTLDEIGYGGFKVEWVSSQDPDGRQYSLTAGAGVGSSLLEGSIRHGDQSVYAKASITPLVRALFEQLRLELETLETGAAP